MSTQSNVTVSKIARALKTERLTLEIYDYSREHSRGLLEALNSPTAHRNLGNLGIDSAEKLEARNRDARVRTMNALGDKIEPDFDLNYVVKLGGKEGPIVGGVSLMQRTRSTPPDLGWCMLEEYQGRGFATESANELLRHVKADVRLEKIICLTGEKNIPSCRVAQKLGFVQGPLVKDEHGNTVIVYVLPGMSSEHLSSSCDSVQM